MTPLTFYKCLADETRLRTVLLIAHAGELCVCEITAALGEIQPKISRHLAQLKKCGFLEDRRQGQWVHYRLSATLPEWCRAQVSATLHANTDFVAPDLASLDSMADRPRRCG